MAESSTTCTPSSSGPANIYFDEKWKLSKKEGRSSATRSTTTSFPPPTTASGRRLAYRIGNSSNRRCAFSKKCARLVKEQRARFYIMRRCITMLICWREYADC